MDYDKIFEGNIDMKFDFNDFPGNKLIVGKISLGNAIARMSKNEYYTLVAYNEGDSLPKEYEPYNSLDIVDGVMFATINPDLRIDYICRNYGTTMVSRLGSPKDPVRYLLGPGTDEVYLDDLVKEQYDAFYGNKMSM